MKYYNQLAEIKRHLKKVLEYIEHLDSGSTHVSKRHMRTTLEAWNIKLSEKEQIEKELKVVEYLISCDMGISIIEDNLQKPELMDADRCFKRHLSFIKNVLDFDKEKREKVEDSVYEYVLKEYLACEHYIEKFSDSTWYAKLPDEILSFQNKYK